MDQLTEKKEVISFQDTKIMKDFLKLVANISGISEAEISRNLLRFGLYNIFKTGNLQKDLSNFPDMIDAIRIRCRSLDLDDFIDGYYNDNKLKVKGG